MESSSRKVVRFHDAQEGLFPAPGEMVRQRRMSDASRRYEASRLKVANGPVIFLNGLEQPDPEAVLETLCDVDDEIDPWNDTQSLVNDADSIDKLTEYIQTAISPHPPERGGSRRLSAPMLLTPLDAGKLRTTFTTIGPATQGTRRRIRNRQVDTTPVEPSPSAGGDSDTMSTCTTTARISSKRLVHLRMGGWIPDLYKSDVHWHHDLLIPYHAAWEIGRRGSIAYQSVKWTLLGTWFPKVTTRYLILDGTDPVSFMTVYKFRPGHATRMKVFTAADLWKAKWDPVGGAFQFCYCTETHETLTEEYFDVSQSFVIAAMTCLREMSVWRSITRKIDLLNVYQRRGEELQKRRSTLVSDSRRRTKFLQAPVLRIQNVESLPSLDSDPNFHTSWAEKTRRTAQRVRARLAAHTPARFCTAEKI